MKSLQSYLTLWDTMDYSPPGSSVHGLLQARILEWVAMPSSTCLLHWQASTLQLNLRKPGGSDGKASAYNLGDLGPIPGWGWSPGEGKGNPLSRQKYWSELPCPPPGVFCIGRQYLTTKPRGKQIFITASKTSTNWKSDRKINLALSMGKCGLLLWKRRLY